MKLYGFYRSSTSYRLRIALNLKGIAYETVPVDLGKARQRDAEYVARNPFAGVPMLQHEGRTYAQSIAMIEWLDEAFPQHPLLPTDTEDRFVARELALAIATELHAPLNLSVLHYLETTLGGTREQTGEWYAHWLGKTLRGVEARLQAHSTDRFLFDGPGYFEAVLIPQLYNARRFKCDLEPYPAALRIEAACLPLPAFAAAHPDAQPDAPKGPA